MSQIQALDSTEKGLRRNETGHSLLKGWWMKEARCSFLLSQEIVLLNRAKELIFLPLHILPTPGTKPQFTSWLGIGQSLRMSACGLPCPQVPSLLLLLRVIQLHYPISFLPHFQKTKGLFPPLREQSLLSNLQKTPGKHRFCLVKKLLLPCTYRKQWWAPINSSNTAPQPRSCVQLSGVG